MPAPTQPREGIALALSGGGYRAMLFHTGALIRLNQLGLLKQLRRVSSVSGGSISAGYLGLVWKRLQWDDSNIATNFEDEYVEGILRFSRSSIDYICGLVGFFTQGLLVSRVVAWYYDCALFKGATLQDLPSDDEGPRFVICATNLSTGSLWRFSKPYMADWRLGRIPRPDFRLSRAVAASSAFPPVLSPLRVNLSRFRFEPDDLRPREDELGEPALPEKVRRRAVLTDGGAYDNHGLEPVDEWRCCRNRCWNLFGAASG
ncbi:MAG TPA: patatin-like phospholipase family protein [Stellaceae bacterium]|jgi:NTE family protein